jgi:hypothetical protein
MALNPKVLSVSRVEYLPAPWAGANKSGCIPVGDRVLILPDLAMTKSQGNIALPDDVVERMQLSASSGVIVEVGDDAFAGIRTERVRLAATSRSRAIGCISRSTPARKSSATMARSIAFAMTRPSGRSGKSNRKQS